VRFQGEAADLKPFDAQLMLPIDETPVSLLLDGTHVGRGSEWSAETLLLCCISNL